MMHRSMLAVLMLLSLVPPVLAAVDDCASARDFVVRARELSRPSAGREDLEKIRHLLKAAIELCPNSGDAWYYRYLCEKRLGYEKDSAYSLRKAKEYGSEWLQLNDEPFTAPVETRIEPLPAYVREKWALVVGISQFSDKENLGQLNFAAKDARDFATLLKDSNYGRFKPENVHLLTDQEATLKRIKQELYWLGSQAGKEDLVVIYFASHGSPGQNDAAGISYVITHDTDYSSPDRVFATALEMVYIPAIVRNRIQAQRTVILLDTCHSGATIAGARNSGQGRSIGISPDIVADLSRGAGRVVITASQSDEWSYESKKINNGYFTRYLIESLQQDKGRISIKKAFEYLESKVADSVWQDLKNPQHPLMSAGERVSEICVGVTPKGN